MNLLTKNNLGSVRFSNKNNSLKCAYFCRFLFVAVTFFASLTSLVSPHNAQTLTTAPFKKCWENPIIAESDFFASDKIKDTFLFTVENKIVSINALSGLVNWSYEISGRTVSNFVAEENFLYVADRPYKKDYQNNSEKKIGGKFYRNGNNENSQEAENEKIYLRSINIASGIPYWSTEIDLKSSSATKPLDSMQTETGDEEQIILGENEDGLFLFDKSGRFASVRKRRGMIERIKNFDLQPSFFLDFEFDEASPKTGAAQKIFAFYSSNFIHFAETHGGEITSRVDYHESPAAGLLFDQKNFVIGDEKGNISSFTLGNKGKWRRIWNVKVGGSVSGLTSVNENLLVTSFDNFVYLFDRNNGKKIWKKRLSGRLVFKPLIQKKENRFIAIENESAYIISLGEGKLIDQLSLMPDEYFINKPVTVNNRIIFQTNTRIISFTDSDSDKGCS